MNIFDFDKPKYKLPPKPKLFEAFAGIGCQRLAFDKLGLDYEMVGISEIDKYAIASYNAIHGDTKNYGDITKIKGSDLSAIDIFTYSFPCQDLSKAGKRKGMTKESRSGLVYDVLRILQELKQLNNLPKVLIMENVADLVSKKFAEPFGLIQEEIQELGYSNYTFKMNAKHYGVAQNRDRVFMVSILGDYYYEQPKPIQFQKQLKDYLEQNVDESYNIKEKLLNIIQNNVLFENDTYIQFQQKGHYEQLSRVWKTIAPTLHTKSADIIIKDKNAIRNLTPKECWRLMGINDSYFDKASQVVSKGQLYKQAGNGIVVDVFAHILKELL